MCRCPSSGPAGLKGNTGRPEQAEAVAAPATVRGERRRHATGAPAPGRPAHAMTRKPGDLLGDTLSMVRGAPAKRPDRSGDPSAVCGAAMPPDPRQPRGRCPPPGTDHARPHPLPDRRARCRRIGPSRPCPCAGHPDAGPRDPVGRLLVGRGRRIWPCRDRAGCRGPAPARRQQRSGCAARPAGRFGQQHRHLDHRDPHPRRRNAAHAGPDRRGQRGGGRSALLPFRPRTGRCRAHRGAARAAVGLLRLQRRLGRGQHHHPQGRHDRGPRPRRAWQRPGDRPGAVHRGRPLEAAGRLVVARRQGLRRLGGRWGRRRRHPPGDAGAVRRLPRDRDADLRLFGPPFRRTLWFRRHQLGRHRPRRLPDRQRRRGKARRADRHGLGHPGHA